jgi:hypothetical protein
MLAIAISVEFLRESRGLHPLGEVKWSYTYTTSDLVDVKPGHIFPPLVVG